MTAEPLRERLDRELERLRDTEAWIPWVRLIAVPFAVVEVITERGNYPPGYERWAWIVTAVFAVGAIMLFVERDRSSAVVRVAAFAFDLVLVSSYVVVYSFELGTPVRQILFLPVVEAALYWGTRGGLLAPLATAPALFFFEWEQSDRIPAPFDPGHVIGPIGFAILIGLMVGALVSRLRSA